MLKEHISEFDAVLCLNATINSDTTTAGAILDTQRSISLGFIMSAPAWTDGTYTLLIQHGDESDLSDAATLTGNHLLFQTQPALGAEDSDGDSLKRQAVISTKRYVRASIVSTSTSTGATIQVTAILCKDLVAVPQAS